VPIPERIAVFDNDGTLWTEQPIYPQFAFVIERLHALAPRFPGWAGKQPFKAALDGDVSWLAAQGAEALLQLTIATHSGMTTDQFDATVRDWLERARHPRFGRRYTELAYQPMLELLAYLQGQGFENWIVSGGTADFIRVWAQPVYGIAPQHVIGSAVKVKFEMADGKALLVRLPEIDFVDNQAQKPVGIHRQIGRRPLMAFGNSDGDLQMLQWTAGGKGPRFAALIRHTDAVREYAYDRKSSVGHLDRALDEAGRRHWLVVSIRDDWARVFPWER
jgi:phosphoserine phosphatase